MATSSSNGYPTPGQQEYSVDEIMRSIYFMKEDEWETDRVSGNFDYVIIGSSFCALSFVGKIIEKKPDAKILVIDRGGYFHPEHFQNLPPPYSLTVGGKTETFPWRITKETHDGEYIKYQHGMNNFFGGRSPFWSAWCPEPTDDEMDEWPCEVKHKVHQYFPAAKKLLNVVPANEISPKFNKETGIFGELQTQIYKLLEKVPQEVESVTRVLNAPLAVRADMYRNEDYNKFSVNGPFLNLLVESKRNSTPQTLKCVLQCLVERIHHENGKATSLETNKGDFTLGNAKLILAMGTLPPTTLMLNSFDTTTAFPKLSNIGKRFTSHFISSIIARVPVDDNLGTPFDIKALIKEKLQMAAMYVAGKDKSSNKQFHIQLTAVIDQTPIANIYDTICHLPDVVAAPSFEQLMSSRNGYIVLVCACLGQMDHMNEKNYYKLNEDPNITCNATLQAVANSMDNALWDVMDDTTFQILENYLTKFKHIDYWSNDTNDWKPCTRPTKAERRVPGLVHEASTMWIGEDCSDAPVDLDYKFRGVENVYLTGAALWPTGASWNPTCSMSALAMDLADKLSSSQ